MLTEYVINKEIGFPIDRKKIAKICGKYFPNKIVLRFYKTRPRRSEANDLIFSQSSNIGDAL
jgi:hypothetical protein